MLIREEYKKHRLHVMTASLGVVVAVAISAVAVWLPSGSYSIQVRTITSLPVFLSKFHIAMSSL